MDLRAKYVFFKEGFDFVVEDSTENLLDRQMLVLDLVFLASAIAHKDTAPMVGFESALTLINVVIVDCNGGGHCTSRSGLRLF